jgi:DNA-binding NtrC family response regulator
METPSMNAATKTLLIVDDEETIHRALARTLRREPYEILHAYDAAEAAALLAARSDVAAVVCDHYMPGTPGLELLIDIRRRYPHVATILLTAQADLSLVISAMNEGRIHRFLTKPWDGDELRGQLRELIFGVSPGGGDPHLDRIRRAEQRLAEELMPMRDERTGAFLIGPDADA